MSLLSVFVLLCCTVVCDSSQTCSGDSCKKFQLNKEHFNKRFRGPGLYEMSVPGHHDCVRNCFYLSPCKSTDYNRKDTMCKLNDLDSTQIAVSDFEQQNGAVFSDITAWPPAMAGLCGSRPCSKRQRCTSDKDTYHCADISCGDAPHIQNGKVVLLNPGKYLYGDTATVLCDKGFVTTQTIVQCNILGKWEKAECAKVVYTWVGHGTMTSWYDAQNYCEDLGGYLADIKSQEEEDFLFNNTILDNVRYFWIGATTLQSTDSFLWQDGTNVSDGYNKWYDGKPDYMPEYCTAFDSLNRNGFTAWPCTHLIKSSLCEFD